MYVALVPVPYSLRLPDRDAVFFLFRSTATWIGWRSVSGASILSFSEDPSEWLSGKSIKCWVKSSKGDVALARRVHLADGTMEVAGVVDFRKLTRLIIHFPWSLPIETHADNEKVVEWVHDIAEEFLDRYLAYVGNDLTVGRFSRNEPIMGTLFGVEGCSINGEALDVTHARLRYITNIDLFHRIDGNYVSLLKQPHDAADGFAAALRLPKRVHDHDRMLFEARELYALKGLNDLSIVLIGVAFEVALRALLRGACKVACVSELSNRKGDTRDPCDAAIEGGEVRDLLRFVDEVCGCTIKQAPQYAHWRVRAYRPRIAVVHKGKRGFLKSDAVAAFDATVEFLRYIESRLPQ